MFKRITIAILAVVAIAAMAAPGAALAQQVQPTATAPAATALPPKLTFHTNYPSQQAGLGETVTVELTLKATSIDQVVTLAMKDVPTGWTASFRSGSRVVQSVYLLADKEQTVSLRLEPSKDIKAGSYKFTATATGKDLNASLPLELLVQEKAPAKLAFSIELPTLKGSPTTTFTYNVTLSNEGDEDLSVALSADTKNVFDVTFTMGGQEVTTIPLASKDSRTITVAASPFNDLQAGSYPINLKAQGGSAQATLALTAEVTGSVSLSLTTPDGRLSGNINSGSTTPIQLTLTNNGTSPARKIEMSSSAATGWTVEFDPKSIAELPSGQKINITVNIKPSDKAVAGDYVLSLTARPAESTSKSVDFRVTVLTSTLWGVVGIVLIAIALGVVFAAVMRFGRR